jgi:hypothetical protein
MRTERKLDVHAISPIVPSMPSKSSEQIRDSANPVSSLVPHRTFLIIIHFQKKRKHYEIDNTKGKNGTSCRERNESASFDAWNHSNPTIYQKGLGLGARAHDETQAAAGLSKGEKEKKRQKEKRKRQKAAKHSKAADERLKLEEDARAMEGRNPIKRRFLVRLPLSKISDLSGRSVCRNFRKADLDLNNIVMVSLQVVFNSPEAKFMHECLRRPLYFVCSLFQLF